MVFTFVVDSMVHGYHKINNYNAVCENPVLDKELREK